MWLGSERQREQAPKYKFDFVDANKFEDKGLWMRLKYVWLYTMILKSFLSYMSDTYSVIGMFMIHGWANHLFKACDDISGCKPLLPPSTAKWVILACIILSYSLLAYESMKAKKVIVSRDISLAFTNVIAYNYYSIRSYQRFCLFDHINNSTELSDDFAFFAFFRLKGWRRLIFVNGPAQTLNASILYALWHARRNDPGPWYDIPKYVKGLTLPVSLLAVAWSFTVLVFAGSLFLFIVAGICYIPIEYRIREYLNVYCRRKVYERVGAIIERKKKGSLAEVALLDKSRAMDDDSLLKDKSDIDLLGNSESLRRPRRPDHLILRKEDGWKSRSIPLPSASTQDSSSPPWIPTSPPAQVVYYIPYPDYSPWSGSSQASSDNQHSSSPGWIQTPPQAQVVYYIPHPDYSPWSGSSQASFGSFVNQHNNVCYENNNESQVPLLGGLAEPPGIQQHCQGWTSNDWQQSAYTFP